MAVKSVNQYRVTFVLDTRGVEETVEALIEEVTKILNDLGCEVEKLTNFGSRYMSRVSRNTKVNQGLFVQWELSAAPEVPGTFHDKFRLDNRVDRIIIERI